MKDIMKREKGKYSEVFEKISNGITYIKTETTVVGKDFEIMNFQREYKPGIKYPMTWEEIKEGECK